MLSDEMRVECARLNNYLSAYEGHFVDGVSFFASGGRDVLEVRLLGEAERPSIVLHLEGVHAYSLQKPTDLDGAFVDSLSVAALPTGGAPWPAGAEELLKRHSGLPDLYLVELDGPFWLVAVASILTVSAAI
ncbi:hypothetical protein ABT236_32465 [Streptomyces sp. NPDC001523]|uniref:hypothetical protein n=1 Tax=Streptomyces sp. NPDC001523 TaxID=3154383 RepID=UPI003329B4A6